MKIGVFSGLRSRLVCLIAGRLTEKENFPGEDEWARAATAFETGVRWPRNQRSQKQESRKRFASPSCVDADGLRSGPKIPRQPRSPADDGRVVYGCSAGGLAGWKQSF